MKIINQIIIILAVLRLTPSLNINAQEEKVDIHKILQDEIQRNMDYLQIEDMQKPFYIGLNLVDINNICVQSTLGAITISKEGCSKRIYLPEVYVGSYELSNLNYLDINTRRNSRRIRTFVPVENSADGISKALWETIDKAYKLAAEEYEAKKSAMNEQVISEEEKSLADFSKEKVINLHLPVTDLNFNKEYFEKLSKELSSIFLEYPDIQSSYVTITGFKANIYFSNSEGSSATYPVSGIRILITADTQAPNGERLDDESCFYALNEKEIPSKEVMINEIKAMANNLKAMRSAPVFDDIYNGPVLFTGQAAFELFAKSMTSIKSSRKLICGDERSSESTKNKLILNNSLNKRIISSDISIIAQPQLKEYKGEKLFGYTPVDMQGVIPPEEIVLVENGVLKSLFSSRNIGINHKNSNGHLRFGYNSIFPGIAPSIVNMKSENELSTEDLKQKLIEQALEEDLEYAIIIKKMKRNEDVPVYIYKVDVETGNEEMVRTTQLNIKIQDYKKIISTSDNKELYNVFVNQSRHKRTYIEGVPASFMSYDGILFKSIEVKKTRRPIKMKLPAVKNPVALN